MSDAWVSKGPGTEEYRTYVSSGVDDRDLGRGGRGGGYLILARSGRGRLPLPLFEGGGGGGHETLVPLPIPLRPYPLRPRSDDAEHVIESTRT